MTVLDIILMSLMCGFLLPFVLYAIYFYGCLFFGKNPFDKWWKT